MTSRKLIGTVIYKHNLAESVWLVRLQFETTLEFVPGQYVSIKVTEEGMRRSYSVASLPGVDTIDLLVDVSPMGVGSRFILNLKKGDSVEVMAFLGRFTVEQELLFESKNMLFIATGTGIAPMRPMLEDILYGKQFPGKVHLVWGVRYVESLYWVKEMESLERDFENFSLDICVSRPTEDWPGRTGRVGSVINELTLEWDKTAAYLCGSPQMIVEEIMHLKEKGVSDDKIFYEKYY